MIGRWTTEEGKEKESYNKRIGEGKKTNNIRDKPDDNNEGKTNGEGANIGSKRNSGTTLRKWGAVLVTLTVVVAGIPITERVARLVRYNYGATRIALAGERQRRRARQEGRKKGRRKFLAPGMSPIPPRGGGKGLIVSILPMRLF